MAKRREVLHEPQRCALVAFERVFGILAHAHLPAGIRLRVCTRHLRGLDGALSEKQHQRNVGHRVYVGKLNPHLHRHRLALLQRPGRPCALQKVPAVFFQAVKLPQIQGRLRSLCEADVKNIEHLEVDPRSL